MMATKDKPVTAETLVTVRLHGEKNPYPIGDSGAHAIDSWANTLSDLTGYKPEFLVEKMVHGLSGRLNMKMQTACAGLCPIYFIVQKA